MRSLRLRGMALRLGGVLTFAIFIPGSIGAAQAPNRATRFGKPERIATCGGFLEGATVDRAGRLWVVDVVGDRILQIMPDGSCVTRAKTGGHPNGARLRVDGQMLIADARGLFAFDPESFALTRLPLSFGDEELVGLNDLTFDAHGGLYVTVPGRSDALHPVGRVFYRAASGAITLVSDRVAFPNGIAVSVDGQSVFVSDFAQKRILSLPAVDSTAPVKLAYVFAYTEGGIGADGLLIAPSGALLAADFGTRDVQAFGMDGKLANSVALPAEAGDQVTNIVVHDGNLYVTEARKGEVWRVPLRNAVRTRLESRSEGRVARERNRRDR